MSLRAPITEKDFSQQVVDAATILGWRTYHTFDSRRSAAGFPDICMVRGFRLIFAELKTEVGKTTEAQRAWMQDLEGTPAEVYLWRPSDIDTIIATLGQRPKR